MDQLAAMRAFVRIVDTGSFTRAAQVLGMPKATTTKLVQSLEAHLRTTLLNRTTRRVTVTTDGAAYYERTLRLLENVKNFSPTMVSKTGVMVGIGETVEELLEVFRDLAARKVDILTIGQYLRPSKDHLPMTRYYTPEEFRMLKEEAMKIGFRHVESGALVRSSYHAHEQAESVAR